MTGLHCPADLPTRLAPYVRRLTPRTFDAEGREQGKRINGFDQCPKCGLWWPCVEEPCAWRRGKDGRKYAIEWWGAAVCDECGILMIEQPDGTPEAYRL